MVDLTKYNKAKWHPGFPSQVFVDVTSQCNYGCVHCIQRDPPEWFKKRVESEPAFMPLDLYRNVVKEVAEHKAVLRICSDGEALLHPNFEDMIALAYFYRVPLISLTTNGYYLERLLNLFDEMGDGDLLDETRFSLEVSLDALYRETYDRIRIPRNISQQKFAYARVMMNIFSFLKKRRATMKFMVSTIDQPDLPREELEAFKRFWGGFADKVLIRPYVDLKGLIEAKNMKRDRDLERWPCIQPFQRAYVCPNGEVRFCADDYRRETVIGKLEYNSGNGNNRLISLSGIWTSEAYKTLRKSHVDGTLSGYTCGKCMEWQSYDWDFNYEQALKSIFQNETNGIRSEVK